VVGCDLGGTLHLERPDLDGVRFAYAQRTNPRQIRGTANEALAGADVFIGLSGPRAVSPAAVRTMASDPLVFAMANPIPEVLPEEVQRDAAVIATGRSDYPNQINNVLAFPGVFRGALDVRAPRITSEMKFAAARAIASVIPEDELDPDYIVPSVFNADVTPSVAAAIAEAAEREGMTRKLDAAAT
jgi:malate dehydrogenase (oxaloacetate-decarboxylating)